MASVLGFDKMNLMAGLTIASEGVLLCAGREIAGPSPERGVVFQNHSLLPSLSCFENVHLAVERVFGVRETSVRLRERTAAGRFDGGGVEAAK